MVGESQSTQRIKVGRESQRQKRERRVYEIQRRRRWKEAIGNVENSHWKKENAKKLARKRREESRTRRSVEPENGKPRVREKTTLLFDGFVGGEDIAAPREYVILCKFKLISRALQHVARLPPDRV
ncbi:hypothetical protein ACLOJK_016594 [Asimina triloba]